MKFMFAALGLAFVASPVKASSSYLPDPDHREIKTMSFAQCTDVIQSYIDAFGKARLVLDAPELRIVQFAFRDQTEQVACDGESNLATVFEVGDQ